ncbi:MAG: hypothetical protein J2P54_17115, partial [Bradyrhizobiaceae bacterium]|nr:hypothetical protein [Bradyrhizobiaceae bacterium]
MRPMSFGWLVTATIAVLVWIGTPALPQGLPPTEPILRIETGMHTAPIRGIDVDAACRLMVTGSFDKTARLWALPESRVGEAQLLRILRVPIGLDNAGRVVGVAISPDGRLAAAGGQGWRASKANAVYVFETATGKLIRQLGGLNQIHQQAFSPDGKYLAAAVGGGTSGGGMRVWETAGWSLVGEDNGYENSASYGVTFDKADRLYTVAWDGLLRRYGREFKLEAKAKTLGGEKPFRVAVHPRGDLVAVGFDDSNTVEVYDAKSLERRFSADIDGGHSGNTPSVAWSSDGTRLYAGGQNGGRIRVWDNEGRGTGRELVVAQNTIMTLLPCRNSIAVGAQDPAFGLLSATGEKQVWQEADIVDMRGKLGENFTVSADGDRVRFGLGNDKPVLFDLAGGRLTDQPQPVSVLAAPDIVSLGIADWHNGLSPKLNGKPLQLTRYEVSHSVAIAPGGDRFVLGSEWFLRAYSREVS